MKKGILLVLLAFGTSAFAQYSPFKKYDFSKGGYSILGMKGESDYNELADKLGEFYTDDISVLNLMKQQWVFNKKSPQYSCGYHYEVLLCKSKKVLGNWDINLNCDEIASNEGYYVFDPQKLSSIKGILKKPVVKNQVLNR